MFSRVVSFTWISIVMDVSKALKNGDDVKALNRTGGRTERQGEKLNLYTWSVWFTHHYLMFASTSEVLTGISGVIDGFVRLDENVSGVKGHHQHRLLRVEAAEVHPQIHKLVLLLVAIQAIWGKLGWYRRVFRLIMITERLFFPFCVSVLRQIEFVHMWQQIGSWVRPQIRCQRLPC